MELFILPRQELMGRQWKCQYCQDLLLLAVTKSPILLNPIMSGWVSLGQSHHFCSQLMPVLLLLFIVYTADKPEGCSIVSMSRKFVSSLHRDIWTCMEIPICFLQGLGKAPREQVPFLRLKSRFFTRQKIHTCCQVFPLRQKRWAGDIQICISLQQSLNTSIIFQKRG